MPEPISGAGAAAAADASVDTNGAAQANAGAAPEAKPVTIDDQNQNQDANASDDGDDLDNFSDDDGEPTVNTRKTAKDFIIQRKNAKIAKLAKQQAANGKQEDQSEDEPDEGDNDGVSGDESNEQEPLEAMRPIVEKHLATEDAKEVDAFLKDHPDFEPYRAKVERWMKHDSRRNLPVSSIFFEVAGEHLMRIGAERARKADQKAKESQAGGGSNRDAVSPVDWSKASREEFEAEQMRVRFGKK